ncbi:hypothetical protein VOM14_27345 [Paraburkholderia sp. MPAMCS5]|uniref:hypothetical protein n=1 Tax=Paraburkholderia sp. MPAMCS5 TaxID=3112563 RepID=UPI002E16C172|nr:hypothetical protein [Paraburkholderia sp. MPAMCS5]
MRRALDDIVGLDVVPRELNGFVEEMDAHGCHCQPMRDNEVLTTDAAGGTPSIGALIGCKNRFECPGMLSLSRRSVSNLRLSDKA